MLQVLANPNYSILLVTNIRDSTKTVIVKDHKTMGEWIQLTKTQKYEVWSKSSYRLNIEGTKQFKIVKISFLILY